MPGRKSDSTPAELLAELSERCLSTSSQLQAIISYRSPKRGDAIFSKVSHSQPPWNSAVALSFLSFHRLSRRVEDQFRVSAELPARPRGGSDVNTAKALEAAVKIAGKAGDPVIKDAIRDLDRWLREARIILKELELPQRLPRLPGKPEPVCPFCKHRSLRMFPLHGYIVCIMPFSLCHDENGKKPRAQMEYSSFTKQFELVWQDNVVGLPVVEEKGIVT